MEAFTNLLSNLAVLPANPYTIARVFPRKWLPTPKNYQKEGPNDPFSIHTSTQGKRPSACFSADPTSAFPSLRQPVLASLPALLYLLSVRSISTIGHVVRCAPCDLPSAI